MSDTRDTLPSSGDPIPAGTTSTAGTTATGYETGTTVPGTTGYTPATTSVGGTDKPSAGDVVDTAKQEAGNVVGTAKEEAKEVGREARTQFHRLFDDTRRELTDQAVDRQERLAQGLRSASRELDGMAQSSTEPGVATDLVRQASQRLDGFAGWLNARDPGAVLEEVKRYARRRPGVFLAGAALAGVLVGRLTRSLAAGRPDDDRSDAYGYRPNLPGGNAYGVANGSPYEANGSPYGTERTYQTGSDATGTTSYGATPGAGTASEDPTDPLYRPGEQG